AHDIQELLRLHRQEHLLHWWSELDPSQRERLLSQIAEIDFEQIADLWRSASSQTSVDESPAQKARRAVPPAQLVRVPASAGDCLDYDAAWKAGEELLRAGRVGVILVAGGEGTRLGFPHAKGKFPIAAVSGKSLFQLLAEQVVARSKRSGAPIPYYVMTSHKTHEETVEFFESHRHFGLDHRNVMFFRQGNMPAVERDSGRLLLAAKDELALNPDGHGGLLDALARSNLIDDMRRRGIDFLYYHQVDNPLARVCDPAFLGFHAQSACEVSTKVVAKLSPEEKMGVVVDIDGRTQVIEYSDLPQEEAARRDAHGELLFWAGSTAMHVFSRSFFERLMQHKVELPFHRAIKKVPCLDDAGRLVEPAGENAVKFERFIFDALPLAERSLVVEARREDEFCPLKNSSGDFSADHVRRSMSRLFAGWLRSAGKPVAADLPVEISPLYALDAGQLAEKLDHNLQFNGPVYLEA
ncbi:MAG TPA: UDPGP type 1 family protein, partial [Planctomycetaceae bacterium]|nr:UDPGP type 1 family protein [Planctomycetaceae bacterium]